MLSAGKPSLQLLHHPAECFASGLCVFSRALSLELSDLCAACFWIQKKQSSGSELGKIGLVPNDHSNP